jgi:hypothetical protein
MFDRRRYRWMLISRRRYNLLLLPRSEYVLVLVVVLVDAFVIVGDDGR